MTKDQIYPPEEDFTPRTEMTRIGEWTLGPTLGRGAYAHVRLATHESGHIAACKILPALHGPTARKVSRDELMDAVEAHKELVFLKGLSGARVPGIVDLEGVISYQGWNFIFLGLYPHSSANISQFPRMIIPFFRRLLISIGSLHLLDISHEDIKRSNVLATENLHPVLVDFGFAHFTPCGGDVKSLGGTVDYSSPEKLIGTSYDPYKSDIWSLGILFLKVMGWRNPYRQVSEDSEDDFKQRLSDGTTPDWRFLGRYGEPGQLGEVIKGMLEPNPAKRWNIPDILSHPSMRTPYPDPKPFRIPSFHPPKINLTEDIILDLAFLAYNLEKFFLCQSLDLIVEKVICPDPNWYKRWAGMLGQWKQREETLWEDEEMKTAVNTPLAKANRGSRLSGVDVDKVSRANLRPLREIHLSPNKHNIPTADRPVRGPTTPLRKAPKKAPTAMPPNPPSKPVDAGKENKVTSVNTPIKKAVIGRKGAPPIRTPKKTRKIEPIHKARSPKMMVRTRSRVKPMLDLTQLPIPPVIVMRAGTANNQEVDLIDLGSAPAPPPAVPTTVPPSTNSTQSGVKKQTTRTRSTVLVPTASSSATEISKELLVKEKDGAPKIKSMKQPDAKSDKDSAKDKENIPPAGEVVQQLPTPQSTDPLRPVRRSPRWT